jgi:hypothetical protein
MVFWANAPHDKRRSPINMRLIIFSPAFFFGISNHYFSYEEKELYLDETGFSVIPLLF